MFQKGISGNPGGRSKIQTEFERKCRECLDQYGFKMLEEMLRHKDIKVRMWALEQILNRGFGKPKESLDVTARSEVPFTLDQIEAETERLIGTRAIEVSGNPTSLPGPA